MLVAIMMVAGLISLAAALAFDLPLAHRSLFQLSNLVGPTTDSMLHHAGLTVCTSAMGTPGNPICFHAARMPLPSLVVGLGILLFGNHFVAVALFKAALFLMPIGFSMLLAWRTLSSAVPRQRLRRSLVAALLLIPFLLPPFLADVLNLQVEEGYSYSLCALAAALLFFGRSALRTVAHESHFLNPSTGNAAKDKVSASRSTVSAGGGFLFALLFALDLDALYLAKSSMILVVAVLTLAAVSMQRRLALRLLLLTLVAAAPIGWAVHQHQASGRYSLGTSLDGINLHKANVGSFLSHYPPPRGASLDQYDEDLNRGLTFGDEWSFNDYHQRAAISYLKAHPVETFQADLRKLSVLFLSLHKYGSNESHGFQQWLDLIGLALFRLLFFAATLSSLRAFMPMRRSATPSGRMLFRSPPRAAAAIYLSLVAATAIPYLLGFAYTRHVSVLIYPTCLLCILTLNESGLP